jgi:hypothetical protein
MLGTTGMGYPYGTADTGTLAKNSVPIVAYITFDDGTIGWIRGQGLPIFATAIASIAYNSSSTPDEYIGVFRPRVRMHVCGIGAVVSNVASGDTFDCLLYRDPFGTPVVEDFVPVDPDLYNTTGLGLWPISTITLDPAFEYGVSIRPDSTNNISISYLDVGTGFSYLKKVLYFGDTLKFASRSNLTGAFTETATTHIPLFLLDVCGQDTGGIMQQAGPSLFLPGGMASY